MLRLSLSSTRARYSQQTSSSITRLAAPLTSCRFSLPFLLASSPAFASVRLYPYLVVCQVDLMWPGRPAVPRCAVELHPLALAGETVEAKLARVAAKVQATV